MIIVDPRQELEKNSPSFWVLLEKKIGHIVGDMMCGLVEMYGTPQQQERCSEIYHRKMNALLLKGNEGVTVAS